MFVPFLLVCGLSGPTDCRGMTDTSTYATEAECVESLLIGLEEVPLVYPGARVTAIDCLFYGEQV